MPIDDLYTAGIASGWQVHDASTFTAPRHFEADVAIIGSGAGGGVTAETLSAAGLRVVLLEEGALRTSDSFRDMDEGRAYRELYQEAAGRATSDGAIAILQGRSVGGSTTVNWSSSFRTPPQTLAHWAEQHAVSGHSAQDMAPWFARMEERLGVAPWAMAPNANNDVLRRGCEQLGWEWHVIPRNVKGCWNSGYCGLGCPVNAKQSMLVSTIPAALAKGATLVHRVRVRALQHDGKRVQGLAGAALGADGVTPTGVTVTVKARHYVAAGGAINTPALLLRSGAPDPHERLGQRTFIHPVNLSIAQMPDRIDPFYGAPQSIASDHFQWKDGATGPAGYKLEVPPLFPGISAGVFNAIGEPLRHDMAALPNTSAMLALLRDGFVPQSAGGRVRVAADGSPILDYEVSDYLWDGVRRAWLSMAEAQFAGGAARVRPAHLDAPYYTSWAEARQAIPALPLKAFRAALFSAHLMGGCGMSDDPRQGVVDSHGSHHQLGNLSVFDGSAFPTSIGANPQLSVFALTAQNAHALVQRLAA
ncbi:GMC family oxidoreductase [Cupriavidus sp. USMAHM13]|uniref:GMC family oxidoreductase n=1 Tax=Cupriavidus malaysiensis TaxID=367825 RepID=A0ABN4TI64_9BURK|nr:MULTISPECIES: GMC family oxidoreductase [Cupriavidus]AOY98170.1 GMC family oxidoreductase [Cupriavidus sp. USMAHM13]AOZ04605.1 GMC family oxidoreductase [Cupriavidus malaysiensis]